MTPNSLYTVCITTVLISIDYHLFSLAQRPQNAYCTCRYKVITHLSTEQAFCCLTSMILQKPVLSACL